MFSGQKNVWLGINSKSLGNFSHCTEYCKYLMHKENTTRFFYLKLIICVWKYERDVGTFYAQENEPSFNSRSVSKLWFLERKRKWRNDIEGMGTVENILEEQTPNGSKLSWDGFVFLISICISWSARLHHTISFPLGEK